MKPRDSLTGLAVLLTVVVAACAPLATREARMDLVRQRASFDLHCSEAVEVVSLGGSAYGARACGKQATYLVPCQDGTNAHTCTAILNSTDDKIVDAQAQMTK